MKQLLIKTKRGGASMFVVIFTIIILSIIVLSFTRLIISEATKTSNTDLSQSAYDSALAGVEDAKIALLRYHACLDRGNTATSGSDSTCRQIIKDMQEGIKNNDCSVVARVLQREYNSSTENSVVVQETQKSSDAGNNTSMLQAYTCVTIKEELEDYRTTLDTQSRLRIIPIRPADVDSVKYLNIRWFSQTNKQQLAKQKTSVKYCASKDEGVFNLYKYGSCGGSSKEQAPPTLSVRLIQTDDTFDISELSIAKADNQTDIGNLYFIPSNGSGESSLSGKVWSESANKSNNQPIAISCNSNSDWLCGVNIELPNTFNNHTDRSDSNTYLLVSMPYGSPETDLSISAYNNKGVSAENRMDFTGVQARIDSTGRANDLYRRIETRVELVDTYFAYPEFEITMTDSKNDSLNKSFYATYNCWVANNGAGPSGCSNSYEDLGFTHI